MSKEKFVYVTYIATTQQKAWQALVDGEMTRQYWQHDNVSDWKPGSRWEHQRCNEAHTVDIVGEVIESTPPRRLVMSWAAPADAADKARHSRVAIDIEAVGESVRLTVIHDELETGSEMLKGISDGWPRVLSSLKSFLETGRPLVTWASAAK
jgi:uncharacterized protein YndB with AHSA1/START domain